MEKPTKQDIENITQKYQEAIKSQLSLAQIEQPQKIYSRQYDIFRQEALPKHLSLYEKICKKFGKFNIKIPSQETTIQESINITHLNITPTDATSLAAIAPILVMILGILISIYFDL